MPLVLCKAPTTFIIFFEYVENIMEMFMDDFSVYGATFDSCLENLIKVLLRCKKLNLVLNYKKIHFMIQGGSWSWAC